MLTIRMQRTGRKGHAQFRVIVQDSRFSPDSGRVVAQLGSYNPHTKATILDKEKAQGYLDKGAQPSERVVLLLKKEGVKLPSWVSETAPKSRAIRNQDKLRRNRPEEPKVEESAADAEPEAAEVESADTAEVEPSAEESAPKVEEPAADAEPEDSEKTEPTE